MLCVFEIYQDVTPLLAEVKRAQMVLYAVIGLAFALVYLLLLALLRGTYRHGTAGVTTSRATGSMAGAAAP